MILNDFLLIKRKNTNRKPSPDTGKVAASAVGRGKCEQIRKKISYKTAVNTCLSFLNDGKNRYDRNVIKGNRLRVKNLGRGCKI